MEKGDKYTIIAIIIVLILLLLLIMNLDKIFPTPTIQQAISQINAT
ncbi:hypothetical protein KY309_01460 [Candidatus Woesearchaeota archaeon]|nr:hypothetical protein [Candidatus Woesearchaeota archaeon]MBW3016258.1 hypothetical protein [Candidatus Woesearchaeota archaeon]